MHYPQRRQVRRAPLSLPVLIVVVAMCAPGLCLAQASPFMTGASALQTNILAWLTPIAIILIMALGGMAMANRIVENCSNTLVLRCSASEHGGTSQFASRLIGEREVLRRQISRGSDREGLFARRGARSSKNTSEQRVTEAAVMPSEIEGLPDFCGYLKVASASEWLKVSFERSRSSERSGMHGRLRFERKYQRPFQ
jgi:hypothetical protein